MDHVFTQKLQAWLNLPREERDWEAGAMMLLQLSGNKIMYRVKQVSRLSGMRQVCQVSRVLPKVLLALSKMGKTSRQNRPKMRKNAKKELLRNEKNCFYCGLPEAVGGHA